MKVYCRAELLKVQREMVVELHIFLFAFRIVRVQYFVSSMKNSMISILLILKKRRNFKTIFSFSCNPEGNLFIQDSDPNQNSKLSKTEMRNCGAQLLAIPPRSPDINPIENGFHLIGEDLSQQAVEQNITRGSFESFSARVKKALMDFPIKVIDNTIGSIHSRMEAIVKNKGQRLKY